jgi:sterol desaturase/sphingolipid hydroxylase (fatty acid hydroxylase superfamily)
MLARRAAPTDQRHRLDKMSLGDLVAAYFAHYTILTYLVLAAAAIASSAALSTGWGEPVAGVTAALLVYPIAEYGLHRWVLHGRFLYRWAWTARVWKRIHYDHHQNPHDLLVLFGALYTTLPAILAVTLPAGWLVGSASGAFAALAAGLLAFAGYEFCHCVQHLPYTPKNKWLRGIKKRHLAHHFHNELGNYGITSSIWDKAFGTLYESSRDVPRSETTYNLGYAGAECDRYPWVAELSATEGEYASRRARRAG